MDTSDPSIYITASPLGKPSVTIKESLEEFGPSKSDEEGRTYTLGHIPTIEDYDAGYGKRRQTFMSDSQDKQQAHSEEVMQQYLKDVHKESSERSQEMEDVALEPARESILSEELLATLKAARVQTPDASDLKVKKSVGPHESMKALMEKRSVRISVVPPEQLQRIEDEFQKKHVQTVVKKGIKEPSDEVAAEDRPKKVSMSAGEKSGDAHALYIEANPTIQSTPNILFTVDEETEDENEIKGESAGKILIPLSA